MPEQKYRWRPFRPFQVAALLLMAATATAQETSGIRHQIAEADIARELSLIGLNVGLSQIHLSAYITSTTEEPRLEVATAESIGNGQVRLETKCSVAEECLPFFATVDVKEPDAFVAEVKLKTHEGIATSRHPRATIEAAPINQARLTVGSPAVMVIRDGHIDIHLQVRAIDSGTVGQEVRVCTLDRKKVFRAIISSKNIVIGTVK